MNDQIFNLFRGSYRMIHRPRLFTSQTLNTSILILISPFIEGISGNAKISIRFFNGLNKARFNTLYFLLVNVLFYIPFNFFKTICYYF